MLYILRQVLMNQFIFTSDQDIINIKQLINEPTYYVDESLQYWRS